MRDLVYLTSARRDLADILRYVARESASIEIAQAFLDQLMQRCDRIASLPGTLGTPRPELRPDIRSLPHRGYIVFFRYADAHVEIVNVLSAARDVDAVYGPEA